MKRLFTVLLRGLGSRPRVAALALLSIVAIALGIAVRTASLVDRTDAQWRLVDAYGFSLLVPVVALVFASAALGDPAEDGTLVYLWLRPVARWKLALAAFAASLTAALPVAVVPLTIATAIAGGSGRLIAAAAVGGTLASVAYAAVFCGLGLRVRRALVWGLVYLLIWEQAVARLSHGAARLSLFINTRSLAARIAGHPPPRNAVSTPVGLILPLVVTAIAVAWTARSLNRGEIA